MNLDKDFWSARYENAETGWDIGYASPALMQYMAHKDKSSRILIPGAGNAYEAEALWKEGFTDITVLDISEFPLQNLKKRMPDFPDGKLVCADFFAFQGQFDIILEQTFFCALNPSLRSDYAAKMAELLKPGAELAGLLFDAPMNADQPPFGGSKQAYLAILGEYLNVLEMEPTALSVKPRLGKEVFFRAVKK